MPVSARGQGEEIKPCYAAHMELTTVAAALGVVEKIAKGFDWVQERVKTSKDVDLKTKIISLYDSFLDLKAKVSQLTDDNAELQRKLAAQAEKPEIRQVGETNYYYAGDKGPYCQPCYDRNEKLVQLSPPRQHEGGTCRGCCVCKEVFYEETKPSSPIRIGRRSSWMDGYTR